MRVWKRDNFLCRYCGYNLLPGYERWLNGKGRRTLKREPFLTVDHMTPLSLGGKWSKDNLVTACSDCNNKKGAGQRKLLEENLVS